MSATTDSNEYNCHKPSPFRSGVGSVLAPSLMALLRYPLALSALGARSEAAACQLVTETGHSGELLEGDGDPMRGLKTDLAARIVIAGHGFVQNLRRATTNSPSTSRSNSASRSPSTSSPWPSDSPTD